MKKILLTTGMFPPDIGGPATYAKLLTEHIEHITVLTYTPLLRNVPKPFRQLLYFFKAWRLSKHVDIVFALSTIGVGLSAALAARWRGKPLIVRVAGDRAWEDAVRSNRTHLLLDDYQKVKKRGVKHRIQVWVCKQASAVIVPSNYLAGIVTGWGIPREKINIIFNSVDLAVPPLSKEEARKELGIQGNVIVSVGRLVPWKGFRMLIKLMPQFLEINPFFRLVIVGDGPDRKLLETMVRNLNLQSKIYLVGRKSHEEVVKYLQAADLMILNSGYEGFSHQVLEAMALGVPIITSATGGNREIIHQGENGFMVKYNDEFNIIEAVKTLWGSPELRETFAAEGKKTAAQYPPERMIEATRKRFETL